MDFGEILEKWERGGAGKNSKTSRSNAMQTWLRGNEVYDKDAEMQRTQTPSENRRRLLRKKPDDILDIHGFTSEKAWLFLEQFFTSAKNNGFEKLRIIHGKGNRSQGEAVLGSTVRKYIELCPFAGESDYEKAANGGTGATWVLLKD